MPGRQWNNTPCWSAWRASNYHVSELSSFRRGENLKEISRVIVKNSSKIRVHKWQKMTITRKIKIGKIWNSIFLSIQHIPHLSCKFEHFWKKKFSKLCSQKKKTRVEHRSNYDHSELTRVCLQLFSETKYSWDIGKYCWSCCCHNIFDNVSVRMREKEWKRNAKVVHF